MKINIVSRLHAFRLEEGKLDVEAAEPVPALSGRRQLES